MFSYSTDSIGPCDFNERRQEYIFALSPAPVPFFQYQGFCSRCFIATSISPINIDLQQQTVLINSFSYVG